MFTYHVSEVGTPQIINSLNEHSWGLAWFEQVRANGEITFKERKLMGDRSEEEKFGVYF